MSPPNPFPERSAPAPLRFPFDVTSNLPEQWRGCKEPETMELVEPKVKSEPVTLS